MLSLPPSVRVYLATQPCDLRKSFNGLPLVVRQVLQQDPATGHLFCFFNRRGNQVRILFWDRTGWCIFAKRLAHGRFHIAAVVTDSLPSARVDAAELSLILEGIDLAGASRRKRYRRIPE